MTSGARTVAAIQTVMTKRNCSTPNRGSFHRDHSQSDPISATMSTTRSLLETPKLRARRAIRTALVAEFSSDDVETCHIEGELNKGYVDSGD